MENLAEIKEVIDKITERKKEKKTFLIQDVEWSIMKEHDSGSGSIIETPRLFPSQTPNP